jgi:hypothetical protein
VLVSAAEAGVNVEDVRVEHLPGRPTGIVELLVHHAAQADARAPWPRPAGTSSAADASGDPQKDPSRTGRSAR